MAEQSFFEAFDETPTEQKTAPRRAGPSFAEAFEKGTDAREPSMITTLGSPVTGAFEGAAELLGMPVDVTAWGLRKVGLPVGNMPIGGSESFKALGRKYMETVGAKPIEPTTEAERLLHSLGKGAAGAVVPAVAAETMLPKIASTFPKTAQTLEAIFAPRAAGVAPMAELAGLGGSSGVGAEIGMEMVPDKWKPLAGLAGGIVGGGVGSLGVAASRTLPSLAQRGMEYIEPLTAGGVEKAAARQLGEAAASPLTALEAIENKPAEIVPGSLPTTFELTGDMGLGQAQRKAETMYPAQFLERKAEQAVARSKELGNVAPTGNPSDMAAFFRQRSQELDAAADQYVTQAEAAARREVDRIGGNAHPDEYGRALRERLEVAKNKMRTDREELYDKVDPHGVVNVDVTGVRSIGEKISAEQGPLSAPLSGAEKDVIEKAKNLPDSVKFKDLRDFDTYVTSEMAKERMANGESPVWRRMSMMKSAIMDSIENSSDSAALDAAKAKHVEYSQTFKKGPVGEALKSAGYNGQYRSADSSVASKAFSAGSKGYESAMAFRKAAGDDQKALDTMFDYVSHSLRNEALDARGVLDPAKFRNWQNRYREALRAFPELANKFNGVQKASESLAASAEAARNVVKDHNTNAFQQISGLTSPQDIQRAIGGIFSSKTPVKQMQDLVNKTATSPDALNGLRRAVAEHIRDRFISNAEAGTSGVDLIKSDSFQTFLRNNRTALGQVFSPDEMTSLNRIATDLHRSNRSVRSTALPGRSTSAQDILPTIKDKKLDAKSLLDVIVGGGGLAMLGSHPVLGMTSMTSAAAHHIIEGLRHEGLQSVNDLVAEAILNPDVAKRLLKKIPAKRESAGPGFSDSLRRVPAYGLIQSERGGYASGGKVGMSPVVLMAMAERSKKKIQSHTKPILDQPDESVVHALKIANGGIN